MPPTLEAIPPPPGAPAISVPKRAGQDSTPPPEKTQLEALLGALAGSTAALPPAAQQMVAAMQESRNMSTTKATHKAVADQSRAKQSLQRIQTQRATYLQAWHGYLSQLAELMEKQLQEQTQVLEGFDAAELQWLAAEQSATQLLAKLTGAEKDTTGEADKDMDAEDSMVDDAIEAENKLRAATAESQESAKRMLTALQDMRQQAEEQLSSANREGSRTPRRGASMDASTPAGEKQAEKPQAASAAGAGQDAKAPEAKFQLGLPPGGARS